MKTKTEVGEFEYNMKMIFGAMWCKWFGHSKKRWWGRCNRCLTLIERGK